MDGVVRHSDGLDKFVDSLSDRPATVQITFRYSGFDVTVSGDGSVSLEDRVATE